MHIYDRCGINHRRYRPRVLPGFLLDPGLFCETYRAQRLLKNACFKHINILFNVFYIFIKL